MDKKVLVHFILLRNMFINYTKIVSALKYILLLICINILNKTFHFLQVFFSVCKMIVEK